jgi:hypothetical protein
MPLRKAVCLVAIILGISGLARSETKWKRVSSFLFDWNGHPKVQVIMEIPASWSDPGDFTRIRIQVPGQKQFVLSNSNGWVKLSSDVAAIRPNVLKMKNLVHSEYVLALDASHDNRTLLFLFGYSYASSPGSLDVIEILHSGQPRLVLHREELGLVDVRDLDGDGTAEIVTFPCLSQEYGDGLLTYDPLDVYTIGKAAGEPAVLSLPLTKSYNLKHYYGWAGPECSEKFAVVLHPPHGGKPFVTTAEKAERMTTDIK